jgi:hypothetical protein
LDLFGLDRDKERAASNKEVFDIMKVAMMRLPRLCLILMILPVIFCQYEQRRGTMGEPMDDDAKRIDTKNSTVWGPGLNPHILTLPARYFYVQLLGPGGTK